MTTAWGILTLSLLLLTVAHFGSTFPDQLRLSEYLHVMGRARLQQNEQCVVRPAETNCKSARLVVGSSHSYVHVCKSENATYEISDGLCFNTKLPRCCPGDLTGTQLQCVSNTTLNFFGGKVSVKITFHLNPSNGQHCIAFDDAHKNIASCCPFQGNGLEQCPTTGPVCAPQRDIYFVVDSTDSVGDAMFCRFGYVLQLIVAAVNQRGPSGARVAAILFSHSDKYGASFLFNTGDQCQNIVSNNIRQVVYEYYGVKNLNLPRESLIYPNVRADNTLPSSALFKAYTAILNAGDRPATVITLTDGTEFRNDPKRAISSLKELSNVTLIAAAIGDSSEVDETALLELVDDPQNIVYEDNRENVLNFLTEIVQRMNSSGALCANQTRLIVDRLEAVNDVELRDYCSRCMHNLANDCSADFPQCGLPGRRMQNFDDSSQLDDSLMYSMWKKIRQEVDAVFAAV